MSELEDKSLVGAAGQKLARLLARRRTSGELAAMSVADGQQNSETLLMRHRREASVFSLIGVATVLLVIAIMTWSAHEADQISLDRDADIASTVLSESMERVAHSQESSTVWDEAVHMTALRPLDLDWIDINLGTWFWTYAGFDEVYILDAANEPLYAMANGHRLNPSAFSAIDSMASPIVLKLRTSPDNVPPPEGVPAMLSPGTSDIVTISGRPAILSVKPIVSDSGEIVQSLRSAVLHIGIVYLDRGYFGELSDQYGLKDARYDKTTELEPGEAHIPLRDSNQNVIGYLIWKPFAPGAHVISTIAPALVLGSILAVCFIFVLSLRLGRRTEDLHASRIQAEHIAFHDGLTGLPNRAQFDAILIHLLAQPVEQAASFAVLYIDLDRFKNINDTLGHPAGDALLKEVARRLNSIIRASDIASRLGGDEFALILRNPVGPHIIEGICTRIVSSLSEPYDLLGVQSYIGASIGVALAPKDGADRFELARKADIALYQAKSSGRGRFVMFDDQMDQAVQVRESLTRDLRDAIVDCENQLQIVYQPAFDVENRTMTGAEALVRWDHPERGSVSPATFIKFAEDSGLIEDLGDWIFRRVICDAKRWPDLRIAVNVSPIQVRHRHFPEKIMRWLEEANIDPRRLELDITESALMDPKSDIFVNLQTLRRNNVQVALDDFGLGLSSLSHIRDIAIDRIKIDQSFVTSSGAGKGKGLVEAIIALARSNDIQVTAEGVETEAQLAYLAHLRCHEVQGFYLSRPLSAEAISERQYRWNGAPVALRHHPAA